MSLDVMKAFYAAFERRDAEAMVALYDDNIIFSDPVFPRLNSLQAKNMWRMLNKKSHDLKVTAKDFTQDGNYCTCTWDAHYSFGPNNRPVHNIVHARMLIKNGKITEHTDNFDFWRWTRMAVGPLGYLAGWTPFLRNKIQSTAAGNLQKFR